MIDDFHGLIGSKGTPELLRNIAAYSATLWLMAGPIIYYHRRLTISDLV